MSTSTSAASSVRSTRIRERYGAWADSGITSLGLTTRDPHALELLTECAREHPARGVDAVTTG